MPLYTFENTKTGELDDFLYSMKEVPQIGATFTDENGETWKRIIPKEAPRATIAGNIDPFSQEQFGSKVDNGKYTVGDLMDISKELSDRRADKNGGVDPVKEKFYEDYSKKRKGAVHPEKQKEEARKKLKDAGISVDN